ncbi:hypothetical protein D9M73_231250 [compost metagenome]
MLSETLPLGSNARRPSWICEENRPPPEPKCTTFDRSHRPGLFLRASSKGMAMASPTTEMMLTCSRSVRLQMPWASNSSSGRITTVCPANSEARVAHMAAPCIIGATAK